MVGATQGRVYAFVFCKEQNDTKCTQLCSYVNTFILLYFLRFQEEGGGGYSPPKSAAVVRYISLKSVFLHYSIGYNYTYLQTYH